MKRRKRCDWCGALGARWHPEPYYKGKAKIGLFLCGDCWKKYKGKT